MSFKNRFDKFLRVVSDLPGLFQLKTRIKKPLNMDQSFFVVMTSS